MLFHTYRANVKHWPMHCEKMFEIEVAIDFIWRSQRLISTGAVASAPISIIVVFV
jgi:hypothetical protein